MKKILIISCLWCCIALFTGYATTVTQDTPLNITPTPKSLVQKSGTFAITPKTVFVTGKTQRDELQKIAGYFQTKIQHATGYDLAIKNSGSSNCISLQIDRSLKVGDEGYQLSVTSKRVSVKAKTPQGLFYGMQSVMQLLPPQIESEQPVEGIDWVMPCVEISDEPAYGYRGMMLDVCRHFHDVEFVKKQLDIMAMFKMNRFHWHLTDDQLWTIEIKKYPRLAQVGSVRRNADGSIHRGFYTQEQIKEVVAYAADRFITVIPEIELPGHALAALTAYPEYSCTGGPFELRNKWSIEENVYCAGNDKTFEFLEDIINEVIPLFPGKYFHIGGDECPKKRWDECPKCQQRIKDENLKDSHELQSYFIHRIEKIILAHGKSMIGWDEILEGGLAPSATVMSWRGEEGGITAASMGHDVIMTPSKWLYVDAGQGAVEAEPIAIKFAVMLDKIYNYDPSSEKIPENLRHHVLGAQCNMWTEYAVTPEYTEYLLYPRMLALAELDWTPKAKKNYNSFARRLDSQLVRLDMHHINYHIPMPEGPMANRIAYIDNTTLTFHNSRNYPMVYTIDGNEPNASSTKYETPLSFDHDATVKIATLLPSGKLSPTRTIEVVKENLMPATDKATQPGIEVRRTEGNLYFVKDVEGAYWSAPEVVKDFDFKPNIDDKGAYCYTGYFEVPADGIYYFSSEMDELQIDGRVVISNDGKLIRHSHTRNSIALQKGKHAFRLLMINNNIGGYLRTWNNKGFIMATEGSELKLPDIHTLSH